MTATSRPTAAGIVIKAVVTFAGVLAAYLVWGLRGFIVPAFAGGLLAYICRPMVAGLERARMPRGLAVGMLLLMFGAVTLVGLNSVRTAIPGEIEGLELRIRALYALNHRYQALMGLDPAWSRGNALYRVTHRDLDPLMDRITEVLALTPDERAAFVASRERRPDAAAATPSSRLLDYDRANVHTLEMRARHTGREAPATTSAGGSTSTSAAPPAENGEPGGLGDILSTWMIAPLIFLFLLWDTGGLKRGLLAAVPNRLFEPAIAVLDDVDNAFGKYVRGIFLECCALGLTVLVFLTLIGVPPRWAIAIGFFTGASNVIPYMGFVAALLSGLGYALLAEDIHPIIPLVTADTFEIWVVAAVALAELLKNVVYEPFVLGGAVELHPLVVVIGVVGGATLFGAAGMLLAIPTITVVRVLVTSSARHLKAYGLV
ncbi:MAG TPA: AI-2E family transporter [Methylomirabilota bacterium]